MADFSTIKGFTVQTLADDPKLSQALGGAWSSGTNYPTSTAGMFGAGITTANVTYGGSPSLTAANKYDGTTWTGTGALNTGRDDMSGGGTQTAAFAVGGGYPVKDQMETYNGTSWSDENDLNTARAKLGGAGTTTSAIVAGGEPSSHTDISEKWNGTSWSEVGNLNTSRHGLAGAGASNTSALVFGGYTGLTTTTAAESWDGTSWTTVGALNTTRYYLAGAGIQTAAIAIGGSQNPPVIANTELWDGSAWAEGSALATAKMNMASGGTNINAMATGGGTPSATNGVEEWVAPSTVSVAQEGQVWYNSTSKVLKGLGLSTPAGAWSSTSPILSGRMNIGYAGTSTSAMIIMGGYNASNPAPTKYYDSTESFDGTTWTEVNNLNAATGGLQGMGTATAAIETGGGGGSLPYIAATELWDGTSWTETGHNTNAGRETFASGGSSTAAMIFGGVIGTPVTPPMYYIQNTEVYDGTTWTEVNNLLVGRQQLQGSTQGTTTAMLAIAGELESGSPRQSVAVEHWDGTCWTEGNDVTNDRTNGGAAGTSTNALRFGGSPVPGGDGVKTEAWNGTSWSEVSDLAQGRTSAGGGNGMSSSAVYCGGKALPSDTGLPSAETWSAGEAIQTFTSS